MYNPRYTHGSSGIIICITKEVGKATLPSSPGGLIVQLSSFYAMIDRWLEPECLIAGRRVSVSPVLAEPSSNGTCRM